MKDDQHRGNGVLLDRERERENIYKMVKEMVAKSRKHLSLNPLLLLNLKNDTREVTHIDRRRKEGGNKK